MNLVTMPREKLANLFYESVSDNPVITREFRTRMREWKAFAVMGGYALFVAAVLFITYVVLWQNEISHHGMHSTISLANRDIGQHLFTGLMWAQVVLLSLAIPALTSGALTQEIEKRTVELLALTRLTPGKVVLGKQLSGMLYSMVLLVCSLPLASLCLVFGGISPLEIALSYLLLLAWCWLLTCAGVFWSSLFNRTAVATLFTYGMVVLYFFVGFGMGTQATLFMGSSAPSVHVLSLINPGWGSYLVMSTSRVCGIDLPVWIAPVVLHTALGVLLLLASSMHVRYCRAERAMPIRLLLLGISASLIWLLAGNLVELSGVTSTPDILNDPVGVTAIIALALLALAASIFTTGRVKQVDGRYTVGYPLSGRRVFRSDLGGGISFMLLWTVVSWAAFAFTLWWQSKAQHAPIPAASWVVMLKVGMAMVAVVFGVSAMGVLFSTMARLRRSAAALAVLFVILIFAGYGICLAYYQHGVSKPYAMAWQLAAFWPVTAISGTIGEWSQYQPGLWWQPKHSWAVVGAAYLAIGLVALMLATSVFARYGGVREE